MTDQDFRDNVIGALSRIETKIEANCDDMVAIRKTLFGSEGRTGLVQEVQSLQHDTRLWNRALAAISMILSAAIAYLGWTRGMK